MRKHSRERSRTLTQLAREGVEKYIDVQKKLLDLAIEQLESNGKASREAIGAARKEARTSWAELTQKSVHNFVTAQKSLMDLAIKPIKKSGRRASHVTSHPRPRHKKVHKAEGHKAAVSVLA